MLEVKPQKQGIADLAVMVIDDDPDIIALMGKLLGDIGVRRLKCFEFGSQALESLDSTPVSPDVILLDLRMPNMDGVEFVRHLGERKYLGDLVFMSAEDATTLRTTSALARAHHLRVVGLQPKPITKSGLITTLTRCIVSNTNETSRGNGARTRRSYTALEIREALNRHEFSNHYQPKVSVGTNEVLGMECLVRWNHPLDGLVAPDQFIPEAEASGLIGEVTREVVRNALRQLRIWHDEGSKYTMAINVTMDDLADLSFADFMITEAREAGVAPESVVLEVTESRLMPKLITVLDVLTRLRLHRFRLSIDDFGTGNSSMVQLRDLPFDELKIDQSFTRNAYREPRLQAFFQANVDLANHLQMETVAEGVETAADMEYVRGAACRLAQGYFIGKPMPVEAIPAWSSDWKQRSAALAL